MKTKLLFLNKTWSKDGPNKYDTFAALKKQKQKQRKKLKTKLPKSLPVYIILN
jgi:hypothetical protein